MKQFTKDVRAKGWTLVEFARELGLTPRQLDRIANAPKRIHILALAGLPDRSKEKKEEYTYVDIVGEGCKGWLNLFYGNYCVALVDSVVMADAIRVNTKKMDWPK